MSLKTSVMEDCTVKLMESCAELAWAEAGRGDARPSREAVNIMAINPELKLAFIPAAASVHKWSESAFLLRP